MKRSFSLKPSFMSATKKLQGEMVTQTHISVHVTHTLDSLLVCYSHEKPDTRTSEAGPEPEPGLELRCVSFRKASTVTDQTVQMSSRERSVVCVCVRGPLGGPEPSNVSLKSDSSVHRLVDFRNGRHPEDQ